MDCNIFIIEFYNKEGDKKTPSPHEWGVRGVESVADTFLTQTYDEFSGNIVANSDLNCCICLKIKIFLMSLPHLPISVDFHQDITLYIQEGHQ